MQFITITDRYISEENSEEQVVFDARSSADTIARDYILLSDPLNPEESADIALDASPDLGNDKPDLGYYLTKKLAEQLFKFQGYYYDCY